MASAKIHKTRLRELPVRPIRRAGEWWPGAVLRVIVLLPVGILLLLALSWVYARYGQEIIPYTENRLVAVSIFAAAVLWHQHLLAEGINRFWSLLFAVLLAGASVLSVLQHEDQTLPEWLHAFGCGVFLYAMLWAFNMYEREKGLPAIASAALVLSMGVLAKPSVLFLCAMFCFVFFARERRLAGGFGNLFLLVFTPLFLCIFSLILFNFLYSGGLAGLWWIAAPPTKNESFQMSSDPLNWWPVAFGATALLCRLFTSRASRPDLAYLIILIVLLDFRLVPWIPGQPSALDLSVMLVCGAACLVATARPAKVG